MHDNFGENLIINPRGGGVYRWKQDDGTSTRAVAISDITGANLVPTVAVSCFRFVQLQYSPGLFDSV